MPVSGQPTLDQSYETSGNAATKEPAEQAAAYANKQAPASGAQRIPTEQSSSIDDATPSALGRGIRGAPPGEEAKGYTSSDQFREGDLEGEQMRAPGEGEIESAVDRKPGASGSQADFASDLDRKKAEQASLRQDIHNQRERGVDVGGAIADRSGPASAN